MNYTQEFESFFATILKNFAVTPDFYKYFIKRGFDPNLWPECSAKSMAVSFHTMVTTHSLDHAKLYFRPKVLSIEEMQLPEESEELVALFHSLREFVCWKQVGQAIVKNPKNAKALVSQAMQNGASLVNVIRIQEVFVDHVTKHIQDLQKGKEPIVKIQDWPLLSESIGGFNPGRILLFVAGTGVGKTTLTMNLALSAIKTMPVLFINMEMTTADIFDRIAQIGASVGNYEYRKAMTKETTKRLSDFASSFMSKEPFFVSDGRGLTVDQIRSAIYRYVEEFKIKLVIIDYDQKIKTENEREEWQAIRKAVEALEEMAKDTQTTIILLAQGDESGDPKASKRSAQPASAVLSLLKENSNYFIESRKNRYGSKFRLKLKCDLTKYEMNELEICQVSEAKNAMGIYS